jgi:predicted  nucleic acid-binding Zn-ribbon protein
VFPVDQAKASPNEFHIDEKGILQPGLKETQHRILPSEENLRAEFNALAEKSDAIAQAEAEVEAKIQAAKDALENEQQKLRDERALFEAQVAEFNKKNKAGR